MELYFKIRMFCDYIIPFVGLAVVVVVCVFAIVCSRMSGKWSEREKRINDKLWEKRERNKDENCN